MNKALTYLIDCHGFTKEELQDIYEVTTNRLASCLAFIADYGWMNDYNEYNA